MNPEKFGELQHQMRQNQSELSDYLADLDRWSSDIKEKDEQLRQTGHTGGKQQANIAKDDLPPVRNSLDKKIRKKKKTKKESVTGGKRISGYDFRAWDKFDADKACEDVDGTPGKAHMSSSDAETDEEWEVIRKKQQAVQMKEQGNQYFKEGQYEESIECYTRGISCDPTNALLPANRAMALIKQQKFGAAELDCSLAISLDPTYLKAYQRRGTSRIELKKLKEAKEDFQFVLGKEPQNKLAQEQLEKIERLMNPPKFSTSTEGDVGIVKPVYKPPHLRSKKPGRRIVIEEVGDDDDEEDEKTSKPSPRQDTAAQKLTAQDGQEFVDKFVNAKSSGQHGDTVSSQTATDSDTLDSDRPQACDTSQSVSLSDNVVSTQVKVSVLSSSAVAHGGEDKSVIEQEHGEPAVNDLASDSKQPVTESTQHQRKTPENVNQTSDDKPTTGSPRLLSVPTSSFQFQSDWKSLRNTTDEFFQYFKEIKPSSYTKLFGQFLDADILMKVMKTLEEFYLPRGAEVFPVMCNLAKVKRFQMTAMFLMDKDKQVIKRLFEHLRQENKATTEEFRQLSKDYGV